MSASGVRKPAESICCNCAGRMAFAVRAVGAGESSPVRTVLLRCRECRHQTSVTAGTIFQDTRTSLRLWFQAMWWVRREERSQRVGSATRAGSEEL